MPLNFTAQLVDNDQTDDKEREMLEVDMAVVKKEAASMLAADACHNADHQRRQGTCHITCLLTRAGRRLARGRNACSRVLQLELLPLGVSSDRAVRSVHSGWLETSNNPGTSTVKCARVSRQSGWWFWGAYYIQLDGTEKAE